MKKLHFILLCLCPYVYAAVTLLLFLLGSTIPFLDNDGILFATMGIFGMLPGILCMWYLPSVISTPAAVLSRQNLQLKLWNLPVVLSALGILIGTILSTNRSAAAGAQEGGLAVFLWILLLLPVLIHSFCVFCVTALSAVRISKCAHEEIPSLLILLHWIPVAAFPAVLWVHRKLND